MIAQDVYRTVPGTIFTHCHVNGSSEVVHCSGLWRKLDIILKTRKSPLLRKQIQCLGKQIQSSTEFNRIMFLLCRWLSSSAFSTCAHIHIYTLYVLHFSFTLIQDDWQEPPFHTSVPQMGRKMPQPIRGGGLVHGE